jgi:hypothetical protein
MFTMGVNGFILFIQNAFTMATSWLGGLVIVVLGLWLAVLCPWKRFFAKPIERFSGLPPLRRAAIAVSISLVALTVVPKGDRGGDGGSRGEAEARMEDAGEMRSLPPELAAQSNLLAVTDFAIDTSNGVVGFEVTWTNSLFDYTASRNLFLFSSTNLMEGRWAPLGTFLMPSDTNSCVFSVTSNGIDAVARPWFMDSLGGIGFYRFGVDLDTDGDGLIDAYERFVSLTDPAAADTDGDGLPDGWEVGNGLDPLSGEGNSGAAGDPDDDAVPNWLELSLGTSPILADTDGDGLDDWEESGGSHVSSSSGLYSKWSLATTNNLVFTSFSDMTKRFTLSSPIVFAGGQYSSMSVSADGLVVLHPETNGTLYSFSPYEWHVNHWGYDDNVATVAPYWTPMHFTTNSRIRMFETTYELTFVEFERMQLTGLPEAPENEMSVQIVFSTVERFPNGHRFHAEIVYGEMGTNAMARPVFVGYRSVGGTNNVIYSNNETGHLRSYMHLAFMDGYETDPLCADTDYDDLSDGEEVALGTDPCRPDTDRDGLPDGWEMSNGLDPLSNVGDDGTVGDSDEDGLENIDEYLNGTDPNLPDTDGDGVNDGQEVSQNSDPTDASDGGQAPLPNLFRELEFNIYGDYAAWEMVIEGLGPDDTRTRKISMGRPNAQNNTPLKMRKGNYYRLSMHWLNCDGHDDFYSPWYCWRAQIDSLPEGCTYSNYSNVRLEGHEIVVGNGWIADNAEGLLTTHVHECTRLAGGYFGGGNIAGNITTTLYILDDPQLVPDLDRDGSIDVSDMNLLANGQIFRFWTNDDNDAASSDGDVANDSLDDFPVNGQDWDSGCVNGRRDLMDLTPIWLDTSRVMTNLPSALREAITIRLRHPEGALNTVWTTLDRFSANAFQTTADGGFGPALNSEARSAGKVQIESGGIELPSSFLQLARSGGDQGVFLVEGRATNTVPLWAEVWCGSKVVCSNRLETRISPVEDMYRWLNSRGLSGENVTWPTRLGEPANMPDNLTSDRHLVFVHGANVTQDGARGWAAEVFKRMWQSGMTAKFTAVTWRSDIGSDANYHENVSNAFFTASAIAQQIKDLPGAKVLMAHSLGNMVCSSMIQDYGLVPACYLMCNSAVPAEAFDTDQTLRVPQLVHPEWMDYPTNSWASSWHWLFRNEPNDDRKLLGWPGRFANVAQYAVNFYSTGDEVLELANNNNVHTWTGIGSSLGHYSWHKQELFKGRGGIGGTSWSGWNIEENLFGVNKISVTEAQTMTEADFRTNTVFYCYPPSMNQPTIPLLVRGAHLAQGIPALAPATGSIAFGGELSEDAMIDLNDTSKIARPNQWPERAVYNGQWCHSDLKDIAYFYVFKFYDKAIKKGSLK